MRRKVNRVGTSTLTISLPSSWARTYGLKPGDDLEVAEDGSRLCISTDGITATPKKAAMHLAKGQPFRRRYLNVTYRDGYDEVEITSDEQLDQPLIRRAVAELLGFELVESHPRRIVVRNVATPNETEFENLFRRLFLVVTSMAKCLLEDMETGQYTHAKEVAEMGVTTNKLYFACQRMLLRKDLGTRSQTLTTHSLCDAIEQIGDRVEDLCYTLCEEKTKLSKPVLLAYKKCVELLEHIYAEYYRQDKTRLPQITPRFLTTRNEVLSLFHRPGLRGPELEIAAFMLGFLAAAHEVDARMYHV